MTKKSAPVPVTVEEARARATVGEDYTTYFWCLVAEDLDPRVSLSGEMEEADLVAPEDVMLAHYQLACWYADGDQLAADPKRAREHLKVARGGAKLALDKDVTRAREQVRKRLGIPAKVDLLRPLGPAMPGTPGHVHPEQATATPLRSALPERKKPENAARAKGARTQAIKPVESVTGLGVTPDGTLLISGGVEGELILWDAVEKKAIQRFESTGAMVGTVAVSPDGRRAVLGSGGTSFIYMIDLATGDQTVLEGHKAYAAAVGWLSNEQIISGDRKGHLFIWDVATQKVTTKQKIKDVRTLALGPDRKLVAIATDDYKVHLHALPTLERVVTLGKHAHLVNGLAFDDGGRRLLSGSDDHTIAVWDVAGRKRLHELRGHTDDVWAVRFVDDDVVSGDGEGALLRWNLATGASTAIAKSPDSIFAIVLCGKTIATGGPGGVRFYDR